MEADIAELLANFKELGMILVWLGMAVCFAMGFNSGKQR